MPLPDFTSDGTLPPGIHAASVTEVITRFGVGSAARESQSELLRQVVVAATGYPTMKRVLVWGSFVTDKAEPNDLDYSVVVAVDHHRARIDRLHRRFFVAVDARQFYGVDKSHLVIADYPLSEYVEKLDFLCHTRRRRARGIVEINLRGESVGERP